MKRLAQYLKAKASWPRRVELPFKEAMEQTGPILAKESGQKFDAFERALPILLEQEGGYVNHPRDPGGRTNLGVTQRVWEAWVKRPATEMEMRRLTVDDVAPLYRKNYWDAVRGDDLPPGVALSVFDFGVNAGPSRAVRHLQIAVGALPDGKIGPKTLKKVQEFTERESEAELVRQYANQRRSYYRQLRTFGTFGKGWLRRVAHIEAEALKLA
jgi:lysozyme family protein